MKKNFTKIDKKKREKLTVNRRSSIEHMSEEQLLDYVYSIEEDDLNNGFRARDYHDEYAMSKILSSGRISTKTLESLKFSKSSMILNQIAHRSSLSQKSVIEMVNNIESQETKVEVFSSALKNKSYSFSSSYLFEVLSNADLSILPSPFWSQPQVPKSLIEKGFTTTIDYSKHIFVGLIDSFQRPIASFIKAEGLGVYDLYKDRDDMRSHINNKEIWKLNELTSFKNWIIAKSKEEYITGTSMENVVFNKKFLEAYLIKEDNDKVSEFYNHEDFYVRMALAMNENLDEHVYEDLADDEEINVQRMIALNSNAPSYVLADLAGSKDLLTVKLIAYNENTPSYVLKELIEHHVDEEVRLESLLNRNAPISLLREKFNNHVRNGEISEYRLLTQSLAWEIEDIMSFLEMSDPEIRFNLLNNPALPQAMKNIC